jgi:hypothetical protein
LAIWCDYYFLFFFNSLILPNFLFFSFFFMFVLQMSRDFFLDLIEQMSVE